MEVIVADDGSTDGSAEWLADEFPEVVVVRLPVNGGFVAAANAGISGARGSVIQLLNNDAEVTDGWASPALRHFEDPSVGSVAPLVVWRSEPDRVDSAGDAYALPGWPFKRGHGEPVKRWAAMGPRECFGASGSSAFYRASALRELGGFDPCFGSYYEDVDLAFRLRWLGLRCVFEPASLVLHEVSATYDHGRADLQRRMSRNAEFLFWANLPGRWLAAAVLPHVGMLTFQVAWKASRNRLGPFLRGKLDAWRRLGAIRERRREVRRFGASATSPPRFPITWAPVSGLRNHARRIPEASAGEQIAVVKSESNAEGRGLRRGSPI